MRLLAVLFIVLISPVIVILFSLRYGGFSTELVKTELVKSRIYEKISETVSGATNDQSSYEEDIVFSSVTKLLTPSYIQTKVETGIDDSKSWVTGKTATSPVVSFRDIKDEILIANPNLESTLDELAVQAKEAAKEENISEAESSEMMKQADIISTLAKNDFSFPLKDGLIGVKSAYQTLNILLPILTLLVMLSVFSIIYFSKSWPIRLKWIGITFIISSIYGYGFSFMSQNISRIGINFVVEQKDEVSKMLHPIIEGILMQFVSTHVAYQNTVSIAFLVIGVICLASSFVFKSNPSMPVRTITSPKPQQKK